MTAVLYSIKKVSSFIKNQLQFSKDSKTKEGREILKMKGNRDEKRENEIDLEQWKKSMIRRRGLGDIKEQWIGQSQGGKHDKESN